MTRNPGTVGLAAALAPILLLTACVVKGPEYAAPEVSVPQTFRDAPPAVSPESIADRPWWEVFGDPALQALIDSALKENYDVQIATARIERARALVGVANAQGKPQLGYGANLGAQRALVPLPGGGDSISYGGLTGGLSAAWEIDVWGRIKRSTEAAQANLAEQEEIRRGVYLTLVSDLASHYFQLIALDRELAVAQESAGAFGQSRDLFNTRFEGGRDNRLPLDRSQALYDASNARVADLRRAIELEENVISLLAGANPRAIMRGRALEAQTFPPAPLGETTALLKRRPDILAAEQTMKRANAEVGVAIANKYPRIGLSALLGGAVADIGGGGNLDSFATWGVTAGLAGPIFDGGRLDSLYLERKAFWDQSIAEYRKTVQVAFKETADALAAQRNLAARRQALESQIEALRRSIDLAQIRYNEGRASYFEILESQQQLYPAMDALVVTKRDQLQAVVSLYKALGGGWNAEAEQRIGAAKVAAADPATSP